MAYSNQMSEVYMTPWYRTAASAFANNVSGQEWHVAPFASDCPSPSVLGHAIWGPMFVPHKIHGVAMQYVQTNAGVSIARDWTFRKVVSAGGVSVAGVASDNVCVLGAPAGGFGATAAAGGNLNIIYRPVTYTCIVQPGQYVKVLATGVVSGINPRFGLLVSPVWAPPGTAAAPTGVFVTSVT